MNSFSKSYAQAGVDITAGYRSVELMKQYVDATKTDGAIDNIGNFGGLFMPNLEGIQRPTFVAGTDGVGTKLKIAMQLERHDTIGIDCVAMCVNDIVCCGAKPLFFLDYIACGKNYPEKIAEIVKGIAEGCIKAGCALIGGETAEHPGVMAPEEYDVAGFVVGVVDHTKILKPETQKTGDVLIGLPSSGVHSNGFSLIRKVFNIDRDPDYLLYNCPILDDQPFGEALLTPTEIYVQPILNLLDKVPVKAISHITGGGFYENIPRTLPAGLTARIERSKIKVPPIFELIARNGKISEREMFNVFNMGIGMTVTVEPENVHEALECLEASGVAAYPIGQLTTGEEGVIID